MALPTLLAAPAVLVAVAALLRLQAQAVQHHRPVKEMTAETVLRPQPTLSVLVAVAAVQAQLARMPQAAPVVLVATVLPHQ